LFLHNVFDGEEGKRRPLDGSNIRFCLVEKEGGEKRESGRPLLKRRSGGRGKRGEGSEVAESPSSTQHPSTQNKKSKKKDRKRGEGSDWAGPRAIDPLPQQAFRGEGKTRVRNPGSGGGKGKKKKPAATRVNL